MLRLPGGCAITCTPESRISSPVSTSRAWPPPKSVGKSLAKFSLTASNVCCSRSRDSRSIWRIADSSVVIASVRSAACAVEVVLALGRLRQFVQRRQVHGAQFGDGACPAVRFRPAACGRCPTPSAPPGSAATSACASVSCSVNCCSASAAACSFNCMSWIFARAGSSFCSAASRASSPARSSAARRLELVARRGQRLLRLAAQRQLPLQRLLDRRPVDGRLLRRELREQRLLLRRPAPSATRGGARVRPAGRGSCARRIPPPAPCARRRARARGRGPARPRPRCARGARLRAPRFPRASATAGRRSARRSRRAACAPRPPAPRRPRFPARSGRAGAAAASAACVSCTSSSSRSCTRRCCEATARLSACQRLLLRLSALRRRRRAPRAPPLRRPSR